MHILDKFAHSRDVFVCKRATTNKVGRLNLQKLGWVIEHIVVRQMTHSCFICPLVKLFEQITLSLIILSSSIKFEYLHN